MEDATSVGPTDQAAPLSPALAGALVLVSAQARRAFPGEAHARFLEACRLLDVAVGQGASVAYARHASACAALLGAQATFALSRAMLTMAPQAGRAVAGLLAVASAGVARVVGDSAGFNRWLQTLLLLTESAPDCAAAVLSRTEALLAEFGAAGFENWVREGLRSSELSPESRRTFFVQRGAASRGAMLRADADTSFAELERQLRGFAIALWGTEPALRAAPNPRSDLPCRTSFDGRLIRMPEVFCGINGAGAVALYRASVAHAGAHLAYGSSRFPRGGLKPMQVALVSLIEDARVEQLATLDFPGLRRLWLPFHVASPSAAVTAVALMARLSRALLDPDYGDDDGWVAKGRRLFLDAAVRWQDPDLSRQLGSLLGNDLGQMRVQFSSRTYVVEPMYRDDNAGIWTQSDTPQDDEDEDTLMQLVALGALKAADRPPERERQEPQQDTEGELLSPPLSRVETDMGIPVVRYPEWDHLIARERQDWTTLVEYQPVPGDAARIDALLARDKPLLDRVQSLIRSAKVSRPVRLRRQPEGETLDLDAATTAVIDRRIGLTPDPLVYARLERRLRDLSVLLLLDVSESTNDIIPPIGRSVLDIEIEATALLAHAMTGLGDPFAVRAFCSDGRNDVRYQRIKDFAQPWDAAGRRRLAGLSGRFSTRIGTALRHAGRELAGQSTYRRLLLVITDGEPSDIDVADRRYLVEDARRTVHLLGQTGIDVFCVGLEAGGDTYLPRMFGHRNALWVDRLERLPEILSTLYLRLTA